MFLLETLKIEGIHARDFLHRISTLNIKNLKENEARFCAFLNNKGQTLSLGWIFLKNKDFYFSTQKNLIESTLDYLNSLIFVEKITVSKINMLYFFVESKFSIKPHQILLPLDGETGILACFEKENVETLDEKTFDYHRLKSGFPLIPQELESQQIFLESSFFKAIDRNKGCYPGQEVIERIFTYGGVHKKLYLAGHTKPFDELPLSLYDGNHLMAKVISQAQNPHQNEWVSYVYVQKDCEDKDFSRFGIKEIKELS